MRRVLPWLLLASWCLFLLLQQGDAFDESEHAHAAYLISKGRVPVRDFFQHHQPLLWDLLRPYFWLGGSGPEVLYAGRVVVLLCAVAVFLALKKVSEHISYGSQEKYEKRSDTFFGMLAVAPLVALSVQFPAYLVARPETPALAGFVLAAFIWLRPSRRGLLRDLLAGLLAGAAAFATPRAGLLLPGFLILSREPERLFVARPFVRLAALAAGAGAFVGGYLLLTGYPITDIFFNLDASSTLQRVGAGHFEAVPFMLADALIAGLLLLWVHRQLLPEARPAFRVRVGFGVLLTVVTFSTTWPHLYPQNLFAPVAWLAVVVALAERAVSPDRRTSFDSVRGVLTVGTTLLCLAALGFWLSLGKSLPHQLVWKRRVLGAVPPNGRVLLAPLHHPITVADASYYADPITGSTDRLAETVRRLQPRWPLPTCDYLADVKREKPDLLDGMLPDVVPEKDRAELERILRDDYEAAFPGQEALPPIHRIYRRRR